jgi:hypothetical protein
MVYILLSDDCVLDVEYGVDVPYVDGKTFAVNTLIVTG